MSSRSEDLAQQTTLAFGANITNTQAMEQPKAYTVGAITRMIKSALEDNFNGIWVEGEVSNYTHHSSGHRYFSLKDERAVLNAVIWRSMGGSLKFEPEPGQKVLARGDITVWEKGGKYQLVCNRLVPVGTGELELAFRQLHEKLTAEGLFDPELKKPIPQFAKRIGIVTSPTGAAIRDIIQIARRRNRAVELLLFPAAVQGDGAEKTIAAGIEYFNSRDDIDLIIIGRGGGSLEDLWPFNTEITVRAIVSSKIPLISAVGHEVDTTLSDLAADLRAATPSAAAELAVWSKADCLGLIDSLLSRQTHALQNQVAESRLLLSGLLSRRVFAHPFDLVRQRQQDLHGQLRLLTAAAKNNFEASKNRLSLAASKLDALSPLKILARGYTVSRLLPGQKVLRSVVDVGIGERMETVLTDGRIISLVEETAEEKTLKHDDREKKST